ncbi:MAG: regulatory protein RecX [Lachnospiraceae bacterium]|nr:regulatory protein RecX [Lachnospiraceae bacterium]
MYITKVEPGRRKRYRVFTEDTFLFALYDGELKQYHIAEHTELADEMIQWIRSEVVYKRAKERALYLLESRPYTVVMMRRKLQDSEYPSDVIDDVILFLEQYHYLDDVEYIRMYVETYAKRKSRKQLNYDLVAKGVARDSIQDYFASTEYSEEESLQRQFQRYTRGRDMENPQVRRKVFCYLYSKGYSASLIEDALREQQS